jgi:hypothetical protein
MPYGHKFRTGLLRSARNDVCGEFLFVGYSPDENGVYSKKVLTILE